MQISIAHLPQLHSHTPAYPRAFCGLRRAGTVGTVCLGGHCGATVTTTVFLTAAVRPTALNQMSRLIVALTKMSVVKKLPQLTPIN
jgi:hypothetical protein